MAKATSGELVSSAINAWCADALCRDAGKAGPRILEDSSQKAVAASVRNVFFRDGNPPHLDALSMCPM